MEKMTQKEIHRYIKENNLPILTQEEFDFFSQAIKMPVAKSDFISEVKRKTYKLLEEIEVYEKIPDHDLQARIVALRFIELAKTPIQKEQEKIIVGS